MPAWCKRSRPTFRSASTPITRSRQDLLDDGQFGQALILSGFNYETAYNAGVELTATYKDGNFSAYGNLAWARQLAKNVVSNQYLFGNDELAYIANNYIYTDHAQTWTASAGASYLWQGTRFSTDMVYGSGCAADLPTPTMSRPMPRSTSEPDVSSRCPIWANSPRALTS